MKNPQSIQATVASPLDAVSQALQKLLADQHFDGVQVRDSGGSLVITANKSPFVLMTIVGHPAGRKRTTAHAGGAIAAWR